MKKARGRSDLEKHRAGVRLTRGRAILAKCYECMGGFEDGTMDCKMTDCPLYPFMPYGRSEP
jgi:hypothetical protein